MQPKGIFGTMGKSAIGAVAAVALLGFAGSAAIAQDAAKPAAKETESAKPAAKKETADSPWIKLCAENQKSKKEECLVTQELRDKATAQLVAAVSVRVAKDEKPVLIVSVPIAVLLEPGMRIQVDKDKPLGINYTICFPQSCVARMNAKPEFLDGLKKGNQMVVSVMRADQKPFHFPITLQGFTKALDGPPVDPKLYQQAQEQLGEQIKKLAEEERKKQEEEAKKDGGAEAPKDK